MRFHRTILMMTAALTALGAARAQAQDGWSAAASTGLVFPVGDRSGSANAGGWVDLLHGVVPHWSVGAEGGYFAMPGEAYGLPFVGGGATGKSFSMYSASAVVRGRSPGPVRFHMVGTAGFYDLVTRTHFAGWGPDQVKHEWNPGISLGLGVSGAGLVRPAFQLRWHEMIGPDQVYMDVVTFEAGLHFN